MDEEQRFHADHADESPTIEGRLQGAFDRGLAEGRHEGVVRIAELEARAIEDATILAPSAGETVALERKLLDRIVRFYHAGIDDRTFTGCVGDVLKEYAALAAAPTTGETP